MNISLSSIEVHKEPRLGIGVLAGNDQEHTWELLGDARDLADRLGERVTVFTCMHLLGPPARTDSHSSSAANNPAEMLESQVASPDHEPVVSQLVARGADEVVIVPFYSSSTSTPSLTSKTSANAHPFLSFVTRLKAVEQWFRAARPRILFVPATGSDRSLAARLAVRCDAELFAPTLLARIHNDRLQVTTLHWDGRRARQWEPEPDRAAILVVNKDVGQARSADASRTGEVRWLAPASTEAEAVLDARRLEADPAEANIEHLPRLIAGGYGLGGREGFDLLRRVAARLSAGVAASRLAVDCGWIERERQVGQTGKTVRPELYIACGISGASHHLEGMSQSRHVLAINTDPQAPILNVAHLGLAADWRQTLLKLESMLPPPK